MNNELKESVVDLFTNNVIKMGITDVTREKIMDAMDEVIMLNPEKAPEKLHESIRAAHKEGSILVDDEVNTLASAQLGLKSPPFELTDAAKEEMIGPIKEKLKETLQESIKQIDSI